MGIYWAISDYCDARVQKKVLAQHDYPPILADSSLFPSTKRRRESVSHHKLS